MPGRGRSDGDAIAVRAQPAGQLVGAPAAAAGDGREGVGDEQDVAGGGHRHPACAGVVARIAAMAASSVAAVRRPAEVLLGAGPRRGAQPAPAVGVRQRVERGGERAGRGAVVEHARLASPPARRDRPQAGQGRRDDRQARGHVLEHLQRRPVEAVPQRRVRVRVERRHADVGGGERGRHRVVGQRRR